MKIYLRYSPENLSSIFFTTLALSNLFITEKDSTISIITKNQIYSRCVQFYQVGCTSRANCSS